MACMFRCELQSSHTELSCLWLPAGELSGVNFLSCNAVINRSTLKPTMTVAQAAQYEDVQFTAALEKLSVEYKASKPLIQQHLSTPSLIHSMDHGFQDFIGRKWRPTALDRFKPEKHKIAVELAALGKPVGNLTVSDVLHKAKVSCSAAVL